MKVYTNKSEASIRYDAKITLCSNGFFKAKEYSKPLEKIKSGFEKVESENQESEVKKQLREGRKSAADNHCQKEIERRSLSRTRDTLIAYASENESEWTSFITLTFKENVTDLTKANAIFHNWRRQITRKYPKFQYLCVPEFQKRGAVHYHMLTNLECGTDIPARDPVKTWNQEKQKFYEIHYHDIPFWTSGFSSAEDLRTFDDKFNVALYITKYLFKDIDNRLWGRNKIMKSNNLKKPKNYYLETRTFNDAMEYIKKCGYDINSYNFIPEERYVTAHTVYTVKGGLSEGHCTTLKELINKSYTE